LSLLTACVSVAADDAPDSFRSSAATLDLRLAAQWVRQDAANHGKALPRFTMPMAKLN